MDLLSQLIIQVRIPEGLYKDYIGSLSKGYYHMGSLKAKRTFLLSLVGPKTIFYRVVGYFEPWGKGPSTQIQSIFPKPRLRFLV